MPTFEHLVTDDLIVMKSIKMDTLGAGLEIMAEKSGIGIWLKDKKTDAIVCICAGFQQGAQVSVRSGGSGQVGHDLSLSCNHDGGTVQICDQMGRSVATTAKEILDRMLGTKP